MIHEGTSTLRHIDQYDQQWWLLARELNAVLHQAYAVVSRFTPEDLQKGSRQKNFEEGDPGPIALEIWFGE